MLNENIRRDEVTMSLPVALSVDELNAKLKELSSHSLRLEELMEERRRTTGDFNTKIKEERGVIKNLAETTTSQQEMRPGKVIRERNFDTGRIRFFRKDTGEEIEERAMTEQEAQMELVSEDVPEEQSKPRGRGRPRKNKGDDAQAAPESANGSGQQQEAKGGENEPMPTHRCLNCDAEFVKEGWFDPKAGDPAKCTECSQTMAKPIAFLQAEEAASNDPPADNA